MRLAVTGSCVLFGALILLALGEVGSARSGRDGFWALTAFALAYCLFAGVWTTSDALSSERRGGTLPLLYLTRLSGGGLLLGKLAASSLSGFYGLVAIFPVLAIPLLAGGVSGLELWLTFLTLVSILMFSLSAGLLASAISVREQSAIFLTFTLLLAPAIGGVIAGTFALFVLIFAQIEANSAKLRQYILWLLLFAGLVTLAIWGLFETGNPFLGGPLATYYLIPDSTAAGGTDFFASVILLWAYTLFYGYSARLCSEWGLRERDLEAASQSSAGEESVPELRYNYAHLRERSPLRWFLVLAGPGKLFLALAVIFPALFVWAAPLGLGGMHVHPGIGFLALLGQLLLAFALARQAAWFFDEARKTGLLEVLLTTPVTLRELVREQIKASWFAVKEAIGILLTLKAGGILLFYTTHVSFGAALLVTIVDAALIVLTAHCSFRVGIWFVLKGRSARGAATRAMLIVGLTPMILSYVMSAVLMGMLRLPEELIGLLAIQAVVVGMYLGVVMMFCGEAREPRLVEGKDEGPIQQEAISHPRPVVLEPAQVQRPPHQGLGLG